MTKRECAIVMAYTGYCMLKGEDFDLFYEYLKEIMGRPIFTHEIPIFEKEIKKAAEADFMALCKNATESEDKE